MRIASIDRHPQKDIWKLVLDSLMLARTIKIITHLLLIVVCLAVWLSGCATTPHRKTFKRFPPKVHKIEKEDIPKVEKEIIKSEPPPISASTPKARAAGKMIEEGRHQLSMGQDEAAERIFQDAINVDPTNGVAYYYLARAKYELGAYEQAGGVLDKAEGLLSGSREWTETIATLRALIGARAAQVQ